MYFDLDGHFYMRYLKLMVLPQIRIYDTSQMGFKLVQTIEAQVDNLITSYHILSHLIIVRMLVGVC